MSEICPKAAFDVVCPATAAYPFTRLGYLTFHVMFSHHGWISYSEGFQSRAARIWPRTPRRDFY